MALGSGIGSNGGVPQQGVELGYAQITANSAVVTSGTATAVTGLTTTVTVGSRPIRIIVYSLGLGNNTTTAFTGKVTIFEDGTQIQQADLWLAAVQFSDYMVSLAARRAPAAGSHTYDVRLIANGTQGCYLQASATAPAFIHVIQL